MSSTFELAPNSQLALAAYANLRIGENSETPFRSNDRSIQTALAADLASELSGADKGNDRLYGMGGDDTVVGDAGNDTVLEGIMMAEAGSGSAFMTSFRFDEFNPMSSVELNLAAGRREAGSNVIDADADADADDGDDTVHARWVRTLAFGNRAVDGMSEVIPVTQHAAASVCNSRCGLGDA